MNELLLLLLILVALFLIVFVFLDFDKHLEKKEDLLVGKLIVIEGIEGVGKSKLIELMKENMPSEWTYTKEPYYIMDGTEGWTKENYQLDRENHVQNKILPLLKQNKVLITNRYWMSGCIYDGWSPEAYLSIWPEPDLIIWLDYEPENTLMKRQRELYKQLFEKIKKENYIPIKYYNTDKQSWEQIIESLKSEIKKIIA